MFEIVFSPRWFYTFDLVFDIFSILVTMLIAMYIHKIYKVSQEKEHKYLYIAFAMMSFAFLFKILTNFEIYFNVFQPIRIGDIVVANTIAYNSHILHLGGLFLFRFLMTIAIYGIYLVVKDESRKMSDVIISSYMIAMITLLSIFVNPVFSLTLVIILAAICIELWMRYKKKTLNTRRVVSAFAMILVGNIFFGLSLVDPIFYVIGETLQLAGFIVLLYNYIMVRVHNEVET